MEDFQEQKTKKQGVDMDEFCKHFRTVFAADCCFVYQLLRFTFALFAADCCFVCLCSCLLYCVHLPCVWLTAVLCVYVHICFIVTLIVIPYWKIYVLSR